MRALRLISLALIALAGAQSAAAQQCFQVWTPGGELAYQGPNPPFSIAWPEVSAEYRAFQSKGHHMVIGPARLCPLLVPSSATNATRGIDGLSAEDRREAAFQNMARQSRNRAPPSGAELTSGGRHSNSVDPATTRSGTCRVWVRPHTRSGSPVSGHYREIPC
jgi:hypothetical protein